MAEILAGEHCSVEFCKQLDFLPFSCDGCGKIFCLEHRSKDDHNCSKCLIDVNLPEYCGPKSYACSLADCQGRELMEVICEHCHQNFCLRHRHQTDHDCEKLDKSEPEMSKTAKHVQQILESKQNKPRTTKARSTKSSKMAAKVALMKLKQRSTGEKGIPETEKTYFNVALPLGHTDKHKAMYFSEKWSIGRIIDNVADVCGLKNENNTGAVQKLRLFAGDSGAILITDEPVERYVEREELFSGSTVILEYVTSEIQELENTDAYAS